MNFEKIEDRLGKQIISYDNSFTSPISSTYKITLCDKREYFIKSYGENPQMLQSELKGLTLLGSCKAIKVPKVIEIIDEYLILEYIPSQKASNVHFKEFGTQLAFLHQIKNDFFGLDHDNFIGRTPQSNTPYDTWEAFFKTQRLEYQYQLLCQKNRISTQFDDLFHRLIEIYQLLLKNHDPTPSLLHGDIWFGNLMVNLDNQVVIIDPASYFGDREADLAMTKLFGGFPNEFYKSYEKVAPLPLGWEKRFVLYNLYHIMNHMNLFGMSYEHQAIAMIKSLLS